MMANTLNLISVEEPDLVAFLQRPAAIITFHDDFSWESSGIQGSSQRSIMSVDSRQWSGCKSLYGWSKRCGDSDQPAKYNYKYSATPFGYQENK